MTSACCLRRARRFRGGYASQSPAKCGPPIRREASAHVDTRRGVPRYRRKASFGG